MKENSKIHLPKPLKANEEGELEMIREVLMNEFRKYKREKEEKFEKKREEKQRKRMNIFAEKGNRKTEEDKNKKEKQREEKKLEKKKR